MTSMKSLTLWISCPKHTLTYRSITYCMKCDYYAGIAASKLLCIYEEK
jgi:hypothetical protein